jgi:hypothetical protein
LTGGRSLSSRRSRAATRRKARLACILDRVCGAVGPRRRSAPGRRARCSRQRSDHAISASRGSELGRVVAAAGLEFRSSTGVAAVSRATRAAVSCPPASWRRAGPYGPGLPQRSSRVRRNPRRRAGVVGRSRRCSARCIALRERDDGNSAPTPLQADDSLRPALAAIPLPRVDRLHLTAEGHCAGAS